MGESQWERKQRHLNEDHVARRKQSKRTIGLIKSQDRIDRITADIESATTGSSEPRALSEEFRFGRVDSLMTLANSITVLIQTRTQARADM
jgi:hypothetical protein